MSINYCFDEGRREECWIGMLSKLILLDGSLLHRWECTVSLLLRYHLKRQFYSYFLIELVTLYRWENCLWGSRWLPKGSTLRQCFHQQSNYMSRRHVGQGRPGHLEYWRRYRRKEKGTMRISSFGRTTRSANKTTDMSEIARNWGRSNSAKN